MPDLLTSGNMKIKKSDSAGLGYLTKILHFAPGKLSGYNVCDWASSGCLRGCLNKSGRGYCGPIQKARIRRTKLFFEDRETFRVKLYWEIAKHVKRCIRLGVKPAVRLNGTSDIPWEDYVHTSDMFDGFPQVMFYDYTKRVRRVLHNQRSNYHLTFSRTEDNEYDCLTVLRKGFNVAVVFRGDMPKKWKRFKVFNGEETDLRFLDPRGVCGLKAKGKAIYDTSGFVVRGRHNV